MLLLMTLLVLFGLSLPAAAEELPGIPLSFDLDGQGRWVLGAELPEAYKNAGAAPGWVLMAVEGVPFEDPAAVKRQVAAGPARSIRLLFETPVLAPLPDPTAPAPAPAPEAAAEPAPPPVTQTLLVVPRDELVRVEILGLLPWPAGFQGPAGSWRSTAQDRPVLIDAKNQVWVVDAATGALSPGASDGLQERAVPELYWELSRASWVVDQADAITAGDNAWARRELALATRVRSFQGQAGDHLLLPGTDGLRVLAVSWPRGTPELPTCNPRVPETCLSAGRQVAAELGDRRLGKAEALRLLGLACSGGVHRGCYEAVAVEDERLSDQARLCLDGDVSACNAVARKRFDRQPEAPDAGVRGLLDYACDLESRGTLGERLRRLADVGEGCMLLARVHELQQAPDLALLTLDRACVLGRADACDEAAKRRHLAFAARTVRECESEELPVPSACVELGRLLQVEPVEAATLDDFGAFLRGCSLGAEEGCVLLGDYVDRWGIDHPRVLQAEGQLQEACKGGEQRACVGSAHLLVRHEPRSDSYGQALGLFVGACEAGLASACEAGAQQRRIGSARRMEVPGQEQMWHMACDLHSAKGCAGLGERLERSKKTWGEAYTAWTLACDLGDAASCTQLGRLVQKKHKEAWPEEQVADSYLDRGCDNGDAEGCYWLAEDELPRRGDPPEPAYLLLEQSCEGRFGPGCTDLAEVHLDRRTSFDDEIAARHLDTACASAEFESCKTLGTMYRTGKGVERDRAKAAELFDKFRFNAARKHVRLGLQVGFPQIVGGELELVLPIPVGPALSVSGSYGYLPVAGSAMVILDGDGSPDDAPDLQFLAGAARLYPNTQARGIYGAAGFHQLTATGGSLTEDRVRMGWDARIGMRSDSGPFYTGIEIGLGQYGILDFHEFDEDEEGILPLILPVLGASAGLAFF